MVRYISHCRGCDDLHVLGCVVPAAGHLHDTQARWCLLQAQPVAEEIELIMLRQTKMLRGSVRQLDIDSGIDGNLTCLTDLSFLPPVTSASVGSYGSGGRISPPVSGSGVWYTRHHLTRWTVRAPRRDKSVFQPRG